MAVTVREDLHGVGTWEVHLNWSPVIWAKLVDEDNYNRPRKLSPLFYDAPVGGNLVYPPLVLLRVTGDEEGITIGGVGEPWSLGADDIGPMYTDEEFVSGTDKLDNGDFHLGDLYWRIASEGSLWVLTATNDAGTATNVGGLGVDDVLEVDRKFPTRPGYAYRAQATGVTGTGRLRIRTFYEGKFNPPNLLPEGDFEGGPGVAWGAATHFSFVTSGGFGGYALAIGPITKPQLISNFGFESTAWPATTSNFARSTAAAFSGTASLACLPIPKPQLVTNGDFAGGSTGWTVAATHAISGGVLTASPNTQPQYVADPGFESGAGPWGMSDGIAGDMAVEATAEAWAGSWAMRVGPNTQLQVLTNPGFDTTTHPAFNGWEYDNTYPANTWQLDLTAPVDGTYCMTTIANGLDHKRLWADTVDNPINFADGVATVPGQSYKLRGHIRKWATTDGYAYICIYIPHPTRSPTGDLYYIATPTINTDAMDDRWNYAETGDIQIPANRPVVHVWCEVLNQTTGWFSFDQITLHRTKGNIAELLNGTVFPVVADTEYLITAKIKSDDAVPTGAARIGAYLGGAGKTAYTVEASQSETDFEWTQIKLAFRPETGYTTAELFVRAADVFGGSFWLDEVEFKRTSNNSATTTHASFAVVPEQRYTLSAPVICNGATRGTLAVGVTLSGSGVDDQNVVVNLSAGGTTATSEALRQEVRPGVGYTSATVWVRSTDVEGGTFTVGEVLLHKADNNTDITEAASFTIVPDQRYLLSAAAMSAVATTNGEVTVGVRLSGTGLPTQEVPIRQELTKGAWMGISNEVRPDPGYDTATPYIRSKDIEGGPFYVDDVTFVKMDNNSDKSEHPGIWVTPERTYRWTQAVRSDHSVTRGTVRLEVVCTGVVGRPYVTYPSGEMAITKNDWKNLEFTFTPPSGYNAIFPRIVGTDIEGGHWFLDNGEMRDTDSGSVVFDSTADSPIAGTVIVDSIAPDGAESVRVQVVAEEGSSGWTVDAVSLARTGVTPATGNSIIADLLKDPLTGDPLAISAGVVNAPDVIPNDWVVQNMTNRAVLDQLCHVVYDGGLQYRVKPTIPATIDVSPDPFTDHGPESAFLPEDIDVEDLSDPETDVENRATRVRVIGAERQTVSGRPFIVTADAQVPGDAESDINGRPIVRTRIVNDGTVDHQGYAQALADDLAAREAEPALALSVKLSGKDTRADCPPGDTVYVWHPESGLEDEDNATEIEGQMVFPRAVKVLSRERAHGPSYRIEMRDSAGVTFELPGVLWSDEDATVLTVGDRLPEFIADPQGTSTGQQYLRDRSSRPR